jgi:hypothetical protein
MTSHPSDRPEILVNAKGLLKTVGTQTVKLEVNRLDPYREFELGWAHLLKLPDTLCDVCLQVGTWIGLGAFSVSILSILEFPTLLTVPLGVLGGAFLLIGLAASRRNSLNAVPFVYRLVLVSLGVLFATMGVSQ